MTQHGIDVIDSQIIAENVGFLDSCFDNSFTLQSSLIAVKEYVAEERNNHSTAKKTSLLSQKIVNTTIQNIKLISNTNNRVEIFSDNVENKIINKRLKDWGLPSEITQKYEQKGIKEMFDWQVACLSNSKVLLDSCNLVYSAPTSAGKTLVAEILMIKTVLERQKKVIVILPFVSIVREKVFYLQDILTPSGIRVEGFMGSQSPPGGLQAVHIAICTIEKANSLVNRLLDDGNICELGAIIVDELHLLGDPHRGYILELLLTKIKYVSMKLNDVQIQIVGMSATLPNLKVLADWLDAELFITQFRPIPLDEYCLVGNKYFDKHGNYVMDIFDKKLEIIETDNVLKICLETIKDGCSILIFCMTKNRCENVAQSIASSFYKIGCSENKTGLMLRSQLKSKNILEVLEQLKNCSVGLDQILKNTISFGVAYHHAGLTFDERDIIESGFKSGALRVLVATSTLSSGVNLPARKVIIRSPVFQKQPINILTYKQMIGRAGRMGRDVKGESILICTEAEKKIGFDLMMGALSPVQSCIESEDKYMRAILELIASQVACTRAELNLYSKCTLLFIQQNILVSQDSLLENTLEELINFELVRIQGDDNEKRYVATSLGKACLSSSLAPNDGLSLFCELQKARRCIVLETDLHLIYLVTPYSVSGQWGDIDWLHLLTLWESLTKAMKRVGELVGVQESFIIRCLRGTNKLSNAQDKLNIHKRFYTALALQDLVNEVSLSEVATKFQCARGFLQSLQQAAATFAGMVTAFCHQLGWKNMEMLISQFQDRLHFGIHSELLELMKLPSLNGLRARTLFNAGFETISSIASADVNVIENSLHKAVPFQREKEKDGDNHDIKKCNKIKNIWITGCCGMTTREAAENLILEARKYLELEIGVGEIKWNSIKSNDSFVVKTDNDIQVNNIDQNDELNYTNDSIIIKGVKNELVVELDKANCRTIKDVSLKKDFNISEDNTLNEKEAFNNIINNDLNVMVNRNTSLINDFTTDTIKIKNEVTGIKCNSTLNDISKFENETVCKVKDEIIWDSLNYTEAIIEDITKRCTDTMLSPNISFGEVEEKVISTTGNFIASFTGKPTSDKDVSLFSSDCDNSSLFEESLLIDQIPGKFLDNKETQVMKLINGEHSKDFISLNSSSIIDAFKSTIVAVDDGDDDEDIKLFYEDENKILENELNVHQNTGLNVSDDIEVICTQVVNESFETDYKSPFKRQAQNKNINTQQPLAKRKKVIKSIVQNDPQKENELKSFIPEMKSSLSKNFILRIKETNLNCFILKEKDVFLNLHILKTVHMSSIYFVTKYESINSNEVIGSNILKQNKSSNVYKEIKNNPFIQGIALYFGQDICIFFDFTSINEALDVIKQNLCYFFQNKYLKLLMMCLKSDYIHVTKYCGIDLPLPYIDVSIAEWLIDSDEKISDIVYLIRKYCQINFSTDSIKIGVREKKLKNLDAYEEGCVKAWFIWSIAKKQEEYLMEQYQGVRNVINSEIQVSKILADCQCYGVTVDKDLASQFLIDVKNSQEILQKKAYKICGYHFNFSSSKDVAKVLGIYRGRKVSTKKSVLTSHNSCMSSIIIFWRKLNSILTKTLYPLTEKACMYSDGNRINPSYTMYTCTGRISMHEPNLQNVPRTFTIPAEFLSQDDAIPTGDVIEFNCRNIFRASVGNVLVSADYCQLEMRILTHYSGDLVLTNIMSANVDVFKSIAASWGGVPEEEVDDDLRQKAKQLCYGIIYGMGNKTLGLALDVTEMEAAVFMDTFYKTYPDIKIYTQSVIEECRKKGYVETLMKRRRYLPDINSNVVSKKNSAERQAVNTTIQGSAADIAKAAMCAIWNRTRTSSNEPRLILQMHDELIYEVPETEKQPFIKVIKDVMENTVRLNVPLPVKVKCGYTWGSLKEI